MRKLFKGLLAMLALTSIMTITSCNKECDPGYEGDKCETEIRAKYLGTYLANGTDNAGGTYTNWTVNVTGSSSDVLTVLINLQNASVTLSAKLSDSGDSYTISSQTVSGFSYTGSGAFTSSGMTLNLTETAAGNPDVIYNFTGVKQ